MMSRINIASWGMLLGALGQSLFFGYVFPSFPSKILFALLAIPWLTTFTISFCQRPPCGPRPFRLILIFAMCWFSAVTALAETLCFILHLIPHGHFPLTLPRVLTYLGALSFVILAKTCVALRRLEATENS